MRGFNKCGCQRGAVSVIFVTLFLVIVGYAAVAASTLVARGLSQAATSDDGLELELIAESGMERAIKLVKSGALPCSSLGTDPQISYPEGSTSRWFDITSGTPSGDQCNITVQANAGSLQRTFTGTVLNIYSFDHSFPSNANLASTWAAAVLTNSFGTNAFDNSTCSFATCGLSDGGSFRVLTDSAAGNQRYSGYRQATIPTLNSGSGLTLTWKYGARKWTSAATATLHTIGISLVDSASGTVTVLSSDLTKRKDDVFYLVSGTTPLPAGRNYDRIRVNFDLQENGKNRVRAHIDEIQLDWP